MSEYLIGVGITRAGLHLTLGGGPTAGSIPNDIDPVVVGEVSVAEAGQSGYSEVGGVINLGDLAVIETTLTALLK